MKKLTFLLVLFICTFYPLKAIPDTCQIGVFITDIYDLNLAEKSFKTTFWMWANYTNDSLDILGNSELINAKEHEYTLATIEQRGNINYASQKGLAEIKKNWDIAHFPLDRQTLTVVLESGDLGTDELVFIADTVNSVCDQVVSLDGWKIENFRIKAGTRTYKTNYGDPELAPGSPSTFATIEFSVDIVRESRGLFFKLFTGLYVAFGISLLVFFMGAENAERFGLLVGSLFAGIANKYVVDSMLPDTVKYTLVDKIHVLTFFFILVNLLLTVVAYRLYTSEKVAMAKRVDRISFWSVLGVYAFLNWWFISAAFE